jgi:hypothetical protein
MEVFMSEDVETVNFMEAIKSGVMFRCENSNIWYKLEVFGDLNSYVVEIASNGRKNLSLEFMSKNFILEEKEITITKSQIEAALRSSYDYNELDHSAFIKKLGL